MDVPVDDVDVEEISPEEAFAILGNETRMDILRALWDAGEPCAFSTLRQRVAPDDKGNFNYHLDKLTSHFVRKTDDGYILRFAGEQVIRAVLSGTITTDPTIPLAATDERCPYCEAPVEMAYEEERILVRCPDCGGAIDGEYPEGTIMNYGFPPAGLAGREREEAIEAAHILYDSRIAPMMKGVCPECAGQISVSHRVCDTHERDDSGLCPDCESRFAVWSQFECRNCLYSRQAPPWFAALNHPTVIAFFDRHGLDRTIPFRKITWDSAKFVRDITTDVVETDPYRFRVTIPVDEEVLTLSVDEMLEILKIETETATMEASDF